MARSNSERQSGGTALLAELVTLQGIYPGGLVWKQSNTIIASFREKNVDLVIRSFLSCDSGFGAFEEQAKTLRKPPDLKPICAFVA